MLPSKFYFLEKTIHSRKIKRPFSLTINCNGYSSLDSVGVLGFSHRELGVTV
jgi:hypothetical protein